MPPYLLLSSVLGAMYGTLFHLWRGKTIRDLLIYLLAGVVGFFAGQITGVLIDLNFIPVGPIHLAEASLVSWAGLLLVHWLKI